MNTKERLLNAIVYNNLIVRSCGVLMAHVETLKIRKELKALKHRAQTRHSKLMKRLEGR